MWVGKDKGFLQVRADDRAESDLKGPSSAHACHPSETEKGEKRAFLLETQTNCRDELCVAAGPIILAIREAQARILTVEGQPGVTL